MLKKIIKLSGSFCAPCKFYAPTFDRVSKYDEYKNIEFKTYDVEDDEGEELSIKYNIRNVPTTLLLDENDELLFKAIGAMQEHELKKIIDETMKKNG